MSDVLVVANLSVGTPSKGSLELLTLARTLGDTAVITFGAPSSAGVQVLAEFGASRIVVFDDPALERYLVVGKAAAVKAAIDAVAPRTVLISSTSEGKEIAARVAVRLNAGLITDAVAVTSDGVATQSVYSGSYLVQSRGRRPVTIITVKPNAIAPTSSPTEAVVETQILELTDMDSAPIIESRSPRQKSSRPDLIEADIVVSGGRGVGSADGFNVVESLADALGGAVGASRAATDAGWYPHQYQVGQTGKTVSPQLYVAAGISGAIQHRAGMQTSKTILAINKDPEAPIFELADYGIVGDLFEVLPQITNELRTRQG